MKSKAAAWAKARRRGGEMGRRGEIFYDILGARILRLQDRLSDLAEDDPRRETIIAILIELDELKRELAEAEDVCGA